MSDAPLSTRATASRGLWRECAGGTIAVALATAVLAMTVAGRFTNYVQPWFKPWLFASALVIGVLGLWTIVAAVDSLDEPAEAIADHHEHAAHSHATPRVAVTLLLPILLFALAAPNSLGAAAVADRPARTRVANATPIAFSPLPDRGVTELTVQDFSDRFLWGDPKALVGKRVRMIGFVAQPTGKPYWTVNRFRIYCCAADANLFTVAVAQADKPQGKDAWVEVTGVLDLDASTDLPVLVPDEVREIPAPPEPYL